MLRTCTKETETDCEGFSLDPDRDSKGTTSIVLGSTSHPARLLFLCDDGSIYETDSLPDKEDLCRFRLHLPRNKVCRLWIRREGSTFRYLTFRDRHGKLSSSILIGKPFIDLGKIGVGQKATFLHFIDEGLYIPSKKNGVRQSDRRTASRKSERLAS